MLELAACHSVSCQRSLHKYLLVLYTAVQKPHGDKLHITGAPMQFASHLRNTQL
jgi:hypothetical protein